MYTGNLTLGAAIVYVVNPKPLISGWGILIVAIVLVGTCGARSAMNYSPSDESVGISGVLLTKWREDVDLPPHSRYWVRPFDPQKELNQKIKQYETDFFEAKRRLYYSGKSVSVSVGFVALGIIVYVVASRGWMTLLFLAGTLVLVAIIHGILRELGVVNSTAIVLVFASLSAGSFLIGRTQGSSLDLYLLKLGSLPLSVQLLSLGVDAPLIVIAILASAVAVGGYLESVESRSQLQFGRAFAVKALIGAIHNVSCELTRPSPDNRSKVARHLRDAAYFVTFGLTPSDSSSSTVLQREQRRVYQGASGLLRMWADEALLPTAATYDLLRSSLEDFLQILTTECDSDLPQLKTEDPPITDAPRLKFRVLRHISVVLIAVVPGACLAAAKLANLPLPDELGGAATLFSVAWASATLLLQFDTSFEKRLAATRGILTIIRDKNKEDNSKDDRR